MPEKTLTPLQGWPRLKAFLHLWVVDHGFLRLPYENLHKLPGPLYRSNQPSPSKIKKYKRKYGIKTIINLRGENPGLGLYELEFETCQNLGIRLIDLRVYSRAPPSKEVLHQMKQVIETMELPAVAHCKSGADRGGLFAVMYRHIRLGHPIEEAIQELHWTYGHFKGAKTGILDYVFDCYLRERRDGQTFMDWVDHDYDRDRIRAEFKPKGWAQFFVNVILRRE